MNIQICKGIATKIDLGKEIKCNIEISKKAYSPGSNVNINVFFGDEQGRFLTEVLYSYRMGYPEGKAYYLKPELLIKDQESKVVFNKTLESFYGLKESGFTFVIPSDWEEGDYTVTVSLDTGPLSGLVSSSCIIKVSKSYSVSATCSSEGKIFPSDEIRVNYGDSKTFTITPNTGYKIKDVKVDSVSVGTVSTYIFQNVTSDHTIEAIFEPLIYAINTSSGIGGSISSSGTISVNYGDSKTFTITPYSGYKISNVKVDDTSVGTVSSYTFTNITSGHIISVTFEKEITKTVVILRIGSTFFTANGIPNTLDSPPVIKNSRTLLPIRAIIEALGGTIGWDGTERKVTINFDSTTIELWIDNPKARVNGTEVYIDPNNRSVKPIIINNRTMLPLRFVAESLGCDVGWDNDTRTITITYGR